MKQDVLAFAAEIMAVGRRVALVTVTETNGSSPATAGQMMAVTAEGESCGTVGGGATEFQLIQRSVAAIRVGERVFTFDIDHGESGMTCGGKMAGFGNVIGAQARLVIFGGGHVAQRLAPLAETTGFSVTVVEDRGDLASAFASAGFIVAKPDEYEQKVSIDPSDYVVICTRGHAMDEDALRFCLRKKTAYLGMIGSPGKVQALFNHLKADGFSDEALEQVFAPIGLAIATGVPAEIAVSILAEMLLIKNHGEAKHLKRHF